MKNFTIGAVAALTLIMLAAFAPGFATERLSVLCATETGNCLEAWSGTDIEMYSNRGSTKTFDVEGSTGTIVQGTSETTLSTTSFDLNDTYIDQDVGTENLGVLPSIVTTAVTYTAAAGGSGTVATIADGEIWLVHKVFINVTTNFDATGDDATLTVGDGNDADGFIVAADANLQTTFTEATGYTAGWYGLENGSNGAYTVDEGAFIYAPSGGAETIDWAIDETSGETLTAGAATIYVVYTRLQ